MKFETKFEVLQLADLVTPPYNPRVDMEPDSPEYKALRRSLENVLSPLKVGWNVDMLRTAGFKQVDMFWRCLNFCGWIAVK